MWDNLEILVQVMAILKGIEAILGLSPVSHGVIFIVTVLSVT